MKPDTVTKILNCISGAFILLVTAYLGRLVLQDRAAARGVSLHDKQPALVTTYDNRHYRAESLRMNKFGSLEFEDADTGYTVSATQPFTILWTNEK